MNSNGLRTIPCTFTHKAGVPEYGQWIYSTSGFKNITKHSLQTFVSPNNFYDKSLISCHSISKISFHHSRQRKTHRDREPEECVIRFETPRLLSASDGLKTRPHSKYLPRIQQRQQQQPAGTMKRVECCIMTNHILFSTVTASTNLCERKDQDLSIYWCLYRGAWELDWKLDRSRSIVVNATTVEIHRWRKKKESETVNNA